MLNHGAFCMPLSNNREVAVQVHQLTLDGLGNSAQILKSAFYRPTHCEPYLHINGVLSLGSRIFWQQPVVKASIPVPRARQASYALLH